MMNVNGSAPTVRNWKSQPPGIVSDWPPAKQIDGFLVAEASPDLG